MKKIIVLLVTIGLFAACSPEANDTIENQTVDLAKIVNPQTVTADRSFDDTAAGLYRGIFVANDITFHGKLTVNAGNDGYYNAVLETKSGENYGFVAAPKLTASAANKIEFVGDNNSGFVLDLSNIHAPVVENATIAGKAATSKLLKETSVDRVMIVLGTYFDNVDPGFNGTWDFLSTETAIIQVPTGFPSPPTIDVTVNVISEIVLVQIGGTVYSDTTMEIFTAGVACPDTFPAGPQQPFWSGPQNIFGQDIDEYAAAEQTSLIQANNASWTMLYSFANGSEYYDIDCNVLPAGTWSWNGRTGSILLD